MIGPFSRSLSLRLLTIFVAMGLVVLVLLASFFTKGMSGQWRRSIQPHLSQYVEYVHRDLGMPPDIARANDIAAAVPVDIAVFNQERFVHSTIERLPELRELQFRPVDRRLSRRLADSAPGPRPQVAFARTGPVRILRVEQGEWRIFYLLNPRQRRSADYEVLLLALAAVGLVLIAGWWIIRQQLRPIAAIGDTVSRISDGELQARTPVRGRDDLAVLGNSINAMAARLQDMLDAKRELLLSVSHELRSPLTRARVALELLPDSSARQRVGQDLIAMSDLIEDLLESERLREAHSALNTQAVDIRQVVTELSGELQQQHKVAITTELPQAPIEMLGDEARLRVLTRTLIHNAIIHGKPQHQDPMVHIRLTADTESIQLDVEDNGPGIAAASLEHVTEAFVRLDASRTRSTGGVGLGLNLASLVAKAHGGSLTLRNRDEGGLRARVWLPRVSAEA